MHCNLFLLYRYSYGSDYSSERLNSTIEDYFSFFFVREPFERLASAYEDKIVRSSYHGWREKIPKNYTQVSREERTHPDYPTFEEFLLYHLDEVYHMHTFELQKYLDFEKDCYFLSFFFFFGLKQ